MFWTLYCRAGTRLAKVRLEEDYSLSAAYLAGVLARLPYQPYICRTTLNLLRANEKANVGEGRVLPRISNAGKGISEVSDFHHV